MNAHPTDRIDAYADGELGPDEARALDAHLALCTECRRELALIRAMGGAMKDTLEQAPARSLWGTVHARITRPLGWTLLLAGVAVWTALALFAWFRAGSLEPRWLAGTAIGVGAVLLMVGIGWEQYRAWREEPYGRIER